MCEKHGQFVHWYIKLTLKGRKETNISSMALSPVEHALKLEACRNRLSQVRKASSLENLTIIDAVERLGTGHHFQDEIEQLLQKLYLLCRNGGFQGMNLHEVALCFRLLRQQGYFVPAGASAYSAN